MNDTRTTDDEAGGFARLIGMCSKEISISGLQVGCMCRADHCYLNMGVGKEHKKAQLRQAA